MTPTLPTIGKGLRGEFQRLELVRTAGTHARDRSSRSGISRAGVPAVLGLVALLCTLATTRAAEPVRVATLCADTSTNLPSGLDDLLATELSHRTGIAVVDRQDAGRWLAERGLSTATLEGLRTKPAAIEGVDRFVLLAPTVVPSNAVAVRIVESRHGIRLYAGSFQVPTEDRGLAALARDMADTLDAQLRRYAPDLTGATLVSVGSFNSGEIEDRSLDAFGLHLREAISSRLAERQDVIVLERVQVGALSDERAVAGSLPPALAPAWRLVDGSFTPDRAPGTNSVFLRIRRSDAASAIAFRETKARADGIAAAADEAVAFVLSRDAASADVTKRPATSTEAARFEQQARMHFETQDGEAALSAAEAAFALEPDNPTNHFTLLLALGLRLKQACPPVGDFTAQFLQTQPLWHRQMDLAESLLNKHLAFARSFDVYKGRWALEGPLRPMPDARLPAGADRDAYRALQARQRALFDRLATTDVHRFNSLFYGESLKQSPAWHSTCAGTLALRKRIFEKASLHLRASWTRFGARDTLNVGYLTKRASWDDAADADKLFDAFLHGLTAEADPVLRAAGWQHLIYRQDADNARPRSDVDYAATIAYASNLAITVERDMAPLNPESAAAMRPTYRLAVINAKLAPPGANVMALRTKLLMLFAADPDDPDRRNKGPKEVTMQATGMVWRTFVSASDLAGGGPELFPKRLFKSGNRLAVVVADRRHLEYYKGPKFGVLWLDASTTQVISRSFAPQAMEHWSYNHEVGFVVGDFFGPVAALWSNRVYVGTPTNGLMLFEGDRPMRRLGLEEGFPQGGISHLVPLGDCLYLLARRGEGLIELNMTNGVVRTLCSYRNKPVPGSLDGRRFEGLTADTRTGELWLLSDEEVFHLDPRGGPAQQFRPPKIRQKLHNWHGNSQDIQLVDDRMTLLGKWQSTFLLSDAEAFSLPATFLHFSFWTGRLMPAADHVLGCSQTTIWRWRPGDPGPTRLYELPGAPLVNQVHDLVRDGRRLYVLSDTGIDTAELP